MKQLEYYSSYIDDEVRKGKTEEEVLEALGDPRLIAKTIVQTYVMSDDPTRSYYKAEANGFREETYEDNSDSQSNTETKFEEYYSSITDKFIASFEIYIASLMDKYSNTFDIGEDLQNVRSLRTTIITYVLVIQSAKEEWLAGPMEELRARLFTYRKIWGIEVIVLNEDMAKRYGLIKEY